jgi:uncharacterized protein YacL
MRVDAFSRLVSLIAFAIGGFYLEEQSPLLVRELISTEIRLWVFPTTGAIVGLLIGPYISTHPARAIRKLLGQASTHVLIVGLIGLVIGLMVAALLAWPLSTLPSPFSQLLPSACALLFSWLGITVFISRHADLISIFRINQQNTISNTDDESNDRAGVLLDTSTIIDGRITDISKCGFITGPIIIPGFVLDELQHIADSSDHERRRRGRRGLDLLNQLKQQSVSKVTITDLDIEGVREVDSKLVMLAKQLGLKIVTNDYNLNKVAELQGITVLNINDLANAVKAICLPGETLEVKIIQEGTEDGQGVGYLADGTMVVVDNGKTHLKKKASVSVTKVLQTSAGRMIFASLQ